MSNSIEFVHDPFETTTNEFLFKISIRHDRFHYTFIFDHTLTVFIHFSVSMDQHVYWPFQSCQFLLVSFLCHIRLYTCITHARSMYLSSTICSILHLCSYQECTDYLFHICRSHIVYTLDWSSTWRYICCTLIVSIDHISLSSFEHVSCVLVSIFNI
jgi:hypothetical protein